MCIRDRYYGGDGLNAAVTPEDYDKLCEIYGSEYSFSYLLFERTIYTFELQEDKVQAVSYTHLLSINNCSLSDAVYSIRSNKKRIAMFEIKIRIQQPAETNSSIL